MDKSIFLWEYLQETRKPIVIYGMGDGCDKIMAVCRKKGIPIQGVFASDGFVREKKVHGFPLRDYRSTKEAFGDMIVLLAFGVFRPEDLALIQKMDRETQFFAPEVPLFGGELFDRAYWNQHREELDRVEDMLTDPLSRKTFRSLLEYKISGRIGPLFSCEQNRTHAFEELVSFRRGDVFADLGAYDGDTALEWNRLHPDHGGILALEPNPKTFARLVKNCREIPRFWAEEAAAWSCEETLFFQEKGGRSASVCESGKKRVRGCALDRLIPRADFIKFDVEGSEKEAIDGAKNLIRKCTPDLCISAYHRTEDLFSLPLQIKRLCPDYRVSIRHFPYVPAWDTVFFFSVR
ncbi:MAG: FkbM family methyltransferase [Clostridia bacterium]|nr:FkbM family methyltransferase [Clostridia bacterium]